MSNSYPPSVRYDGDTTDVNWEEIARWVIENPEEESYDGVDGDEICPISCTACKTTPPPSASPSIANIDWEKLAESFMQRQVDAMESDAVDPSLLGSSINDEREIISPDELQYVQENWERLYEEKLRNLPSMYWDASRREKKYNPEQYYRRKNPDAFVYQGNDSSLIRTSFFEHDDSSVHPLEYQTMALSGMEGSFLHDTTQDSDILEYLEDRYERIRPNSVAEGYHLAGHEYGPPDVYMWPRQHRAFTSTPIRRRSSMAESFEMVDGSKMINVTLEEMAEFSKRIHHVTDVRDTHGREIVHIEKDYETDPDGVIHRVEKARRWLDYDYNPELTGETE